LEVKAIFKLVIPSRRNPGGVKRGEESPAETEAETVDDRIAATGRGFFAVLSPIRGIGGSE